MSIEGARVTVTDTATALNVGGESDLVVGKSILATNRNATNSVDVGGSAVASGAGHELKPGESVTIDLTPGEVCFAIAAAAQTVRVDVLRVGV